MQSTTTKIYEFWLVILTLLCINNASAQGLIHLQNPSSPPAAGIRIIPITSGSPSINPQAQLVHLNINVDIQDSIATVELDQIFRNPNNQTLEGIFYYPLPKNAAVDGMSLYIDGKPIRCEVMEADKARNIYENIVRSKRDPALLEYIDRDLVQVRIFPIEPHQERRVRFRYRQTLTSDGGLTEYLIPLRFLENTPLHSDQITLTGTINTRQNITTLYSPSTILDIERIDENQAKFQLANTTISERIMLYFATTDSSQGFSLLTSAPAPGEQAGYFMLFLSPGQNNSEQQRVQKDITFVFDTSGSMQGQKIEQAKDALLFCLQSLDPEDRFRIIRFSTETQAFAADFLKATPQNKKQATEFVKHFRAVGGTAIHQALTESLQINEKSARPHWIVFLTDGKPTIGQTNPDKILNDVTQANQSNSRIFVFGVGNSVNTHLLDEIADENRGTSDYVLPSENIEVKISRFFQKMDMPVLTDLKLEYAGVQITQQYPRQLPDLFAGSQILISGRYQNNTDSQVTLTGTAGDLIETSHYALDFGQTEVDFLPRLWAIRRIGYLSEQIRNNGEQHEIVQEVTQLGKQYAIATPYTSLLVLEDDAMMPTELTQARTESPVYSLSHRQRQQTLYPTSRVRSKNDIGQIGANDFAQQYNAPAPAITRLFDLESVSGSSAVQTSKKIRAMKEGRRIEGIDLKQRIKTKTIAGRTFKFISNQWIENGYKPGDKLKEIKYGSDQYFDLLAQDKNLAAILAIGQRLIFKMDNKWIRIAPDNKERF